MFFRYDKFHVHRRILKAHIETLSSCIHNTYLAYSIHDTSIKKEVINLYSFSKILYESLKPPIYNVTSL